MPSLDAVAFWSLASLTLGSAGGVAFSRNIIRATLSLLGTLMGVAGFYAMLSADFLAASQVLIYVGGTLTLILFAVMLTARMSEPDQTNPSVGAPIAFAAVAALLVVLGRTLELADFPEAAPVAAPSTARLGHGLLGEFLLPFELGSVLLLGALIGAVVLARRAVKRAWERG